DSLTDSIHALPGMNPTPAEGNGVARFAGYEIEDELRAAYSSRGRPIRIAGVDEAGRGAWAGPVVVCAAVTDLSPPPVLTGRAGRELGPSDSTMLTGEHRAEFAELRPGWLAGHAVAASGPEASDEVGMTDALLRAAVRAL